jgi:hypothetical protein
VADVADIRRKSVAINLNHFEHSEVSGCFYPLSYYRRIRYLVYDNDRLAAAMV